MKAFDPTPTPATKNRVVVRVRTGRWGDSKGIHLTKSVTYLKRQSEGFNFVDDDVKVAGADTVIDSITNLLDVSDGVYEIVIDGYIRDWETNCIEEWTYKLVPIK